MAVGSYVDSDGNNQGLIDTLSGGTWSLTEAPLPADASTTDQGAYLKSLSCPAAGSCVAVGTYDNANGSQGLIETLSDGTWTPTTMPAPDNSVFPSEPNATRGAVSCPAVGSCVAVWGYEDTVGTLGDVIETLSDGTWTPLEAPLPANASPDTPQSDLDDLTCPGPGECMAVGTYNINPYGPYWLTDDDFIETLSGGTWTPTEVPVPANARLGTETSLGHVSCPSAESCIAIGDYVDSEGRSRGLIDTLSDDTWTSAEAPLPANANQGQWDGSLSLSGLACPAVGSCVVVGGYNDVSGSIQGLMETLSAGTWTPTEAPLPANANSQEEVSISDLTCPAVGSCVAVGVYDTSSAAVGLLETLSGGTWTSTEAPLPANSSTTHSSFLSAVDCRATDSCFAVGGYDHASGGQDGLIEALPDGSPTTSTTAATSSTITLGESDTDVAAVTGNASNGSPTGTMTFYECGPTMAPAPCTSTANPVGGPVDLTPGPANNATATSPTFTPNAGGYWCFAGFYSGDTSYDASSDTSSDACLDVPPAFTSASMDRLTEGVASTSFQVTAIGGYSPVTFTKMGVLPGGVTLTSGGLLSGTPESLGAFPITITATDASGNTAIQSFVLDVQPPLTITSATTASFTEGAGSVPFQVVSAGGYAPVTYSETGLLPSGVTLSSAGLLSGTPGWTTGQYPVTITATDAVGSTATQSFVLAIAPSSILHISTTSPLLGAQVRVPYSFTLTASGASLPYTWTLVSSSLPRGLKLHRRTGTISGTPTSHAVGSYSFEVQVKHKQKIATATFSISVS